MLITELLPTADEATLGDRLCRACGFEAMAYDQFCRRCGLPHTARLAAGFPGNNSASLAATNEFGSPSPYATVPLAQEAAYRHVTDPLVKSLTASLLVKRACCFENRLIKGLLLALIVMPIWLLMLSLSPFDAFLAARTAVNEG